MALVIGHLALWPYCLSLSSCKVNGEQGKGNQCNNAFHLTKAIVDTVTGSKFRETFSKDKLSHQSVTVFGVRYSTKDTFCVFGRAFLTKIS